MMCEQKSNKRNHCIDVLKGIGICLVVFAHIYVNPGTEIVAIIYSFHMPLFFFISGVLYRKKDDFKEFIWTKIKRIVVPYFLWAFLSFFYWVLIERSFRSAAAQIDVSKAFAGIFVAEYDWLMCNPVLWFLPVLFGVSVLFDGIVRLNCRKYWKLLLVFVCAIIGIILFEFPLPWGVNKVFRYLPFFAIGYVGKELLDRKGHRLYPVIAGLIFVVLGSIDMILVHLHLTEGVWFYVTATVGIFSMCGLAYLLSRMKWLQFLGRNTMLIYLAHGPFYRVLVFGVACLMHSTTEMIRGSEGLATVLSVITLAILGIASVVVNKYAPWTIGNSKRK